MHKNKIAQRGKGASYNTNKTKPNTNEITKGDGGGHVLFTFRGDA
jgi:hypothetical protein